MASISFQCLSISVHRVLILLEDEISDEPSKDLRKYMYMEGWIMLTHKQTNVLVVVVLPF